MEGNVKVHVESRTRLPDMEDVLHFRGSGTLERTPSGWQLRYQARSDEDGSLMTSELWLEDCGSASVRWAIWSTRTFRSVRPAGSATWVGVPPSVVPS